MLEWTDRATRELEFRQEVLSFRDYMKKVEEKPLRECRPTFKYLSDMLRHQGGELLFERDDLEAPPVFGQQKAQEALSQNLVNFQEEGFNNKFILLVGPNGSSKSSIVRKFIRGAELYSQTEEGALYTFSWIFPVDNFIKGPLGCPRGRWTRTSSPSPIWRTRTFRPFWFRS